jgi:hypothetical protein
MSTEVHRSHLKLGYKLKRMKNVGPFGMERLWRHES